MKYKSRLTALLLALMMIITSTVTYASTPLSELTGDVVTAAEETATENATSYYDELASLASPTAVYARMYELYTTDTTLYNAYIDAHDNAVANGSAEIICMTCVAELAYEYITTWPASEYNCLYSQLANITASQAYDILSPLAEAEDDLYWAYVSAHNTHTLTPDSYAAVMCWTDVCTKFVQLAPVQPGAANHDSTCPWSKEEYVATRTVTDEATGITVTGRIPDGVGLAGSPVTLTDEQLTAFSIENEEIVIGAYDIKLIDANGDEWQPAEGVKIVVDFDATLLGMSEGLQYQVRHQHGDEVTISDVAVVTDGKATYVTDNFSIFTVTGLWGVATSTDVNELTMYVGETIYLREDNGNSNNWQVTSGDEDIIEYPTYTKPDGSENTQSYCQVTANATGTVTLRCGNYNSVTITIIEKPAEIFDVKIEDQIYTNGCLVPVLADTVTETDGITYKWYKNSNLDGTGDYTEVTGDALSGTYVAADAANGVNVAVDQGGKCWYKVEATLADGTTYVSEPYWVPYSNVLENGSFETPNITSYNPFTGWGNGNVQFNQDDSRYITTAANVANGTALWWRTTGPGSTNNAPGRDIEIVRPGNATLNGVYYVTPADGNQYAELNCEAIGTLYQDVLTAPNTTLTWSFSHLGREDTDTMAVVVMPATVADEWADKLVGQETADGINDILEQIKGITGAQVWDTLTASAEGTDTTPDWTTHSGTYQTVEGQYLSRFFFVSVSSASNNLTMGNLIDGVSFDDKLTYTIRYYLDGVLQSRYTETGSAKPFTIVAASNTAAFSQYALDKIEKSNNGTTEDWGSTSLKIEANDTYLDIFYVSTGISITKKVEVVDPNGYLTADELAAAQTEIWEAFGNATFNLTDSSGNVVATATVAVNGETGEGVALFMANGTEFKPAHNATYTIVETSSHSLDGYAWTKDENISVTIPNNTLAASAEYTNTYTVQPRKGNLTITKFFNGVEAPTTGEIVFTVTDTADSTNTQTVTLSASDSWAAKTIELVVGTYTVTEGLSPEITDYNFVQVTPGGSQEAVIVADTETELTFTNVYEKAVADLTIIKAGSEVDENDTFLFTVTGPDNFSMDVIIKGTGEVTIADLPVGTYTVSEDANWAWRYAEQEDKSITLSSTGENTVTFTNTKDNNSWLDGSVYVENNFTGTSVEATYD